MIGKEFDASIFGIPMPIHISYNAAISGTHTDTLVVTTPWINCTDTLFVPITINVIPRKTTVPITYTLPDITICSNISYLPLPSIPLNIGDAILSISDANNPIEFK